LSHVLAVLYIIKIKFVYIIFLIWSNTVIVHYSFSLYLHYN